MRFAVRVALGLAVVMSMTAMAGVPQLVNFQGILKDGSGNPVANNNYPVTFTIYDAASAGTALWAETTSVTTSGGRFTILLGSLHLVPDSAFNNPDRWMGIKVGGDPEMVPRQRLVSQGYAYRVGTVDGATGGTITSKVSIGLGHTNTGTNAFVAGESNEVSGTYSSVGGGFDNTASGASSTVGGGQKDTASGSFAVVSGGSHNVASGRGSTIGGGTNNNARGFNSVVGGGGGVTSVDSNSAVGDYSTVGGGMRNTAIANWSLVGGGRLNFVSGQDAAVSGGVNNQATGQEAAVGGGSANHATAYRTYVGGGNANRADSSYAAVTGGAANEAKGTAAMIGGGLFNQASGSYAVIGGGQNNRARGDYSVIGGGGSADPFDSSVASGNNSVVAGGAVNRATGTFATISGGAVNNAAGQSATVSGGEFNSASGEFAAVGGGKENSVSGPQGTVAGGMRNIASDSGATVGGGRWNRARGVYSVVGGGGSGFAFDSNVALGPYSTVSGGKQNHATAQESAIAGGTFNTASGQASFVGGGSSNRAGGGLSVVGGGLLDTASGAFSTVPGGRSNKASGSYSFAAGYRAKAIHNGAFVWADQTDADFASTAADQFLIRAAGGVGIGTTSPIAGLHVKGAGFPRAFGYFDTDASAQDAGLRFYEAGAPKSHVYHQAATNTLNLYGEGFSGISVTSIGRVGIGTTTPSALLHVAGTAGNNTGVWSNLSDRRLKRDIEPIDNALEIVNRLEPVSFRWEDREKDAQFGRVRGLIAQDVEKVIPEWIKTDPDGYKRIEPIGDVALLIEAIQEQQRQIEESKVEAARLRSQSTRAQVGD